MGKIIKGGIEYGGSGNRAVNIAYVNTTSGLTATNIQAAVDELDSNISSTAASIPSAYIKTAAIDSSTGSLSLTKEDNTSVTLTLDAAPTKDSKNAVTSDGVYMNTAGKKIYSGTDLKGELFNNATDASGQYSHAEGDGTTASGYDSHAEGYHATASGHYSHAGGYYTQATQPTMTAIGKYNSPRTNDLFNIGNGTGNNARSNIVEVNSASMNVNGAITINSKTVMPIVELTDTEYAALSASEKSADIAYLVTETIENNRSIIVKDSNGDFKYEGFVYGVVANGTTGWSSTATDPNAPTTPPTKADPTLYTTLMFGLRTAEKTVYFTVWNGQSPVAYGRATDADASNMYFILTGNSSQPYAVTNGTDTFYGNFVTTLTTDTAEFGRIETANKYIVVHEKNYGDLSSLASVYLTQTAAASTYLSKTDASSTYLSKTDATSTYLTKTDAASTYVALADIGLASTSDIDAMFA